MFVTLTFNPNLWLRSPKVITVLRNLRVWTSPAWEIREYELHPRFITLYSILILLYVSMIWIKQPLKKIKESLICKIVWNIRIMVAIYPSLVPPLIEFSCGEHDG